MATATEGFVKCYSEDETCGAVFSFASLSPSTAARALIAYRVSTNNCSLLLVEEVWVSTAASRAVLVFNLIRRLITAKQAVERPGCSAVRQLSVIITIDAYIASLAER